MKIIAASSKPTPKQIQSLVAQARVNMRDKARSLAGDQNPQVVKVRLKFEATEEVLGAVEAAFRGELMHLKLYLD